MDLIGAKHPFFRPAWRRYAVVGSCAVWAGIEWMAGDAFWAVLFTGLAGLSAWELIFTYTPPEDKGETDGKS